MAAKKTTKKAPPSKKPRSGTRSVKKNTGKNSSKTRMSNAAKKRAEWELQRQRMITAIILFMCAVFFLLIFFVSGEKLWHSLHEAYHGFLGTFGFVVPVVMLYCSFQNTKDEPVYNYKFKAFSMLVAILSLSTAVFCFGVGDETLSRYADELHRSLLLGSQNKGTGVLGSMLGIPLVKLVGTTGGGIISILVFLVSLFFSFDRLIIGIIGLFKQPVKEHIEDQREIRTQVRKKQKEIRDEKRKQAREEYIEQQINKKLKDDNGSGNGEMRKIRNKPFYSPEKGQADPAVVIKPDTETKKQKRNSTPKKKKPEKEINELDSVLFGEPDAADALPPEEYPAPEITFQPEPPPAPEPVRKAEPERRSEIINLAPAVKGQYIRPPYNLLRAQPREPEKNISYELNQQGAGLVETLKSFGVRTSIVNICRGPTVTRYELQPAAGVKISKIKSLSDDIAMNLAATGVRIEAPIPGKSAVGIEVPNKTVTKVFMRDLVESDEFINAKSNLTVILGKDITGKTVLADLAKMPHLLIAGSTGSGKSVCINSMLVSLIYKSDPNDVKLMLIDPKVVELGVYNGIPHLLVPVVTDPRKAAGALNWAVNEMLNRYKTFAEYNVRDMYGYNRFVEKQNAESGDAVDNDYPDDPDRTFEEDEMLAQAQTELMNDGKSDENSPRPQKLEKMPQIVIIVDELADLMMAAPKDVEEAICRLAQMARAAGMHMILATQRPSVDVITGLIKANVPSRISFAVKTGTDSRTILDTTGAEKLLGFGDMLFSPIGVSKAKRIQGCLVEDTEIEPIVEFIKSSKAVEYNESVMEEIENTTIAEAGSKGEANEDDMDPMIEEAIKCVVEAGQASTSMLQRRFRVGYARAGRLIDEMEQMGIIGPHEGSKPRQVLMTYQQWMERNVSGRDD